MPLGIEPNSTAPQLIQNAGQALVQGIRQIGQQVSSHLTEIQTRRDIGALGQELQNISVESPDWSTQVTGLLSRHPLAARDERAQMALSILSKAHNQWQENQRPINIPGVGLVRRDDGTVIREAPQRPMSVAGVGLVQPNEIDPVTGQPKILIASKPSANAARPVVAKPGDVLFDTTGKKLAENPKPAATATPYQQFQMERAKRTERRAALKTELDTINRDIKALEDTFHKTRSREKDAGKEELPTIRTEISQLGTQLQALGEIRDAKVKEMAGIDQENAKPAPAPDNSPYPTETDVIGTVAPPLGAITTTIKRDPKTGRRWEVDINTKQVIREIK